MPDKETGRTIARDRQNQTLDFLFGGNKDLFGAVGSLTDFGASQYLLGDAEGRDRQVGDARQAAGVEAFRLANQENDARRNALGVARGAVEGFRERGSGFGADELRTAEGAIADRFHRAGQDDLSSLRRQVGSLGITGGGTAAGLAVNSRLQIQQMIANATRDLHVTAMDRNAQHSLNVLQAEFGLAGQEFDLGQGSMLRSDFLNQLSGALTEDRSNAQAIDAAKDSQPSTFETIAGFASPLIGAGIGRL